MCHDEHSAYELKTIIIRVLIAVTVCLFRFAHCLKHCFLVIKRYLIVFLLSLNRVYPSCSYPDLGFPFLVKLYFEAFAACVKGTSFSLSIYTDTL